LSPHQRKLPNVASEHHFLCLLGFDCTATAPPRLAGRCLPELANGHAEAVAALHMIEPCADRQRRMEKRGVLMEKTR
jgi:hypothetical protein